MVVRLGGARGQVIEPLHNGPQSGPDPAWARFERQVIEHGGGERTTKVSVRAIKPDSAAYRILGRDPYEGAGIGPLGDIPQRNRYNSSVYVSSLSNANERHTANTRRIPVVGEIAAGQYDLTVAFQEYDCLDYEGGVPVDKALARDGAYALRVRGTSMAHVGIEPGDVVIIKPQSWAENGDFVVAAYNGDAAGADGLATLKRFYRRRDHIFLQSASAQTNPIILRPDRTEGAYDPDPIRIQGIVTMVLKAS